MADLKNIKEGDEFELEMGNGYKAVFKALKVAMVELSTLNVSP